MSTRRRRRTRHPILTGIGYLYLIALIGPVLATTWALVWTVRGIVWAVQAGRRYYYARRAS